MEWEREIERCRQLGLAEPKPLPHPDHIKIDMRDGSVRITGPMTREGEAVFDEFRAKKAEFQAEITEIGNMAPQRTRHSLSQADRGRHRTRQKDRRHDQQGDPGLTNVPNQPNTQEANSESRPSPRGAVQYSAIAFEWYPKARSA